MIGVGRQDILFKEPARGPSALLLLQKLLLSILIFLLGALFFLVPGLLIINVILGEAPALEGVLYSFLAMVFGLITLFFFYEMSSSSY